MADEGFFAHLSINYRAPYIYVECKNYTGDPAKSELDGLAGRFSNRRGQVGIHFCRKLKNKELFIQRCRDTADDDRGFIVPLDDADLTAMVAEKTTAIDADHERLLRDRFDRLVMWASHLLGTGTPLCPGLVALPGPSPSPFA